MYVISNGQCYGNKIIYSFLGLSLQALCFHRLISPHNKAVTSYYLGAISASQDLLDADNDAIVCK